ncbi:Uncharacterized protein PCOAH_00019300 [Plasmodium coatneyi]|uniref:KIR protein n=1 Tax=Plasmodium coatneyi TaxID=208452 RepID=A0A1B1DXJ0_9APIC|nr:Uncharacterized protein PCOAH_00019300 [Plasmodium coatneyi]ANQ07531.1 Uncharacterized protein PCOAH_00019300 [Plasmodium coatneyi]
MVNAWCYVTNKLKEDKMNSGEYCLFLYFWIGNILVNRLSTVSFSEPMHTIYTELGKHVKGNDCTVVYNDNNQTTFNQRKTAYEYLTDYGTIQQKLSGSHQLCNKDCSKYLEDSYAAYDKEYDGCTGQDRIPYCREFVGKDGKHQGTKLTKLTCQVVNETQIQANMGGGGSSIPTAIISSTLATTVGLPAAVAFFLYKYHLIPFGIKNTLFGGNNNRNNNRSRNRRRERRSVDHHFDVSTENSSTFDSTDISTIGDWSTTSSSTINRTNRGRANNNKRQRRKANISYQNM